MSNTLYLVEKAPDGISWNKWDNLTLQQRNSFHFIAETKSRRAAIMFLFYTLPELFK